MAFNGISNLRDGNESVQVEPWMLKELAKCAKDPIYFIRNYVYINTKDKGMQLFAMYEFQEELIGKFDKYRFNIAKYPRQAGKCFSGLETIDVMNEKGEEMTFTLDEFYNLLEELNEE